MRHFSRFLALLGIFGAFSRPQFESIRNGAIFNVQSPEKKGWIAKNRRNRSALIIPIDNTLLRVLMGVNTQLGIGII